MPPTMPSSDLELLSAYLDGQLSPKDEAALRERLAVEAELRQQLAELRQTVQILRAAPPLVVPRNFTLDPARFRRAAPWWARDDLLRLLGSLGTAASILLIALGVFLSASQGVQPELAQGIAMEATAPMVMEMTVDITVGATQIVVLPTLPPSPAMLGAATTSPPTTERQDMRQSISPLSASTPTAPDASASEMVAPMAAPTLFEQADATITPMILRSAPTQAAAPLLTLPPTPQTLTQPTQPTRQPTLPLSPTPLPPTAAPAAGQDLALGARFAVVVGLMLLLVSAVTLGIGWLRSRL